jgi:HEAT repeat protein
MEPLNTKQPDIKTMLADYMENGFLDNIIDMFKHDATLYAYVGDLITDERMRVRIGTSALIESLKKEDSDNVNRAISYILPALHNENPVYRGDAAYLLGVIGDPHTVTFLEEMIKDEDPDVRLIAQEAIEDIRLHS